MKTKRGIFYGTLFFAALCLVPVSAFAEEITDFTAHIEMRADGTAFVQEEILYDFGKGAQGKHGILRKIPLLYDTEDGKKGQIELANIAVTDGKGHTRDVETTGGGNYINLKIGDLDTTLEGQHLYVIKYVVYGAFRRLPTVDEIYWNVTGNEWQVPIVRSRVEVILPQEFPANEVKSSCYKGYVGSTEGCMTDPAPGNATGTVRAIRALSLGMAAHEGVTIAVGIPKGYIAEAPLPGGKLPSAPGIMFLLMTFLVPLATFGVMFRLWWMHGRDPKGRGTLITEYDPPSDLTPMEVAALVHSTIGTNTLSAEIVSLAARGYLSIERVEIPGVIFDSHDYVLMKKKYSTPPPPHDVILLDGIFADDRESISLSVLKQERKMPSVSAEVTNAVYRKLVDDGYFIGNPQSIRASYFLAGLGIAIVGFFATFLADMLVPTGIIIAVFGWFMPRVSDKGAAARDHALGFKRYLSVAEKERLEFTDAPEAKPETFEKFFPFAMALGVSAAWAKQFAGIYDTAERSPSWYSGTGGFSSVAFASAMSDFSSSTSAATVSSGGSGGGGFSGGGSGGGGGGSW